MNDSKKYLTYLYAVLFFLIAFLVTKLFTSSSSTYMVDFINHWVIVFKPELFLYSSVGLAIAGLLDWRISQIAVSRNEKYRKIQSFAIITSVLLFNVLGSFSHRPPRRYYRIQESPVVNSAFLGIDLFKFVSAGITILAIIFSLFLLMLFIEFLYRTFRRV